MRKYNIPLKEIKEVKQEIVECSSGGGEGVKEYYYKCKTFEGDSTAMLNIATQIVHPLSAIIKFKDKFIDAHIITSLWLSVTNFTPYFKIIDIPYVMYGVSDGNIVNVYGTFTGNLLERLLKYSDIIGTEFTEEMYNMMVEEITKEEYEAMITYKP